MTPSQTPAAPTLGTTAAMDAIDVLIRDTATKAELMSAAVRGFDETGAATGIGIRLKALQDARDAVMDAGIRLHEAAAGR
jgi:hypothetical protein